MKRNTQKGITLIALIITIIILLILAGIALNLTLGENGIINIAKRAQIETQKANEKEQITLAVANSKMDNVVDKKDEIATAEQLKEKLTSTNSNVEVIDNGDNTITVIYKDTNREYLLDEQRNIEYIGEYISDSGLKIKKGSVKVTRDIQGNVGINSVTRPKETYINFEVDTLGDFKEVTIEPSLPHKITDNGSYKFIITGTKENGETKTLEYTKDVNFYIDGPTQYLKFNGTSHIQTDIQQTDIADECTIAFKLKLISNFQQANMGVFGNHTTGQGILMQFGGYGVVNVDGVVLNYLPYYDEWIDIIVTRKDRTTKLYIDQQFIGEYSPNLTAYPEFFIGLSWDRSYDRRMYGEMSCFKVWTKAMTEQEVKHLDLFSEEVTINPEHIYRNIILKSEEEVNKIGTFIGTGHEFINN